MIKDYSINVMSDWVKYSDYEIINSENSYYIIPTKNSRHSVYDPFDVSNDLLKDILSLGKYSVDIHIPFEEYKHQSIEYKSKNHELQEMVLDFVRKYGLLGIANEKTLSDYTKDDELEIQEHGVIKNISKEEYIKSFFPFVDFSRYILVLDFCIFYLLFKFY